MADQAVELNLDLTIAQPAIWDRLQRIVETDRVGSAYLFSGPPGSGKEAMAIEFATLINCGPPDQSHPDRPRYRSLQHEHLKIVVPLPTTGSGNSDQPVSKTQADQLAEAIEKKAADPFYKIRLKSATRIRIESIRELRKSLYLKSHYTGTKIVLLFDAHTLSMGQGESANALLKILEEPPSDTTLILVTDHKTDLFPTILSRCQHIDFPPLTEEVIEHFLAAYNLSADDRATITALAQGNFHQVRSLLDQPVNELQDRMISLARSVIARRPADWRDFIQTYGQMVRQAPEEFRFHMLLLQVWFKGAQRQRNGLENEINMDRLTETFQSFNKKYQHTDFHRIQLLLDETIDGTNHNLFMPLKLTNLLTAIQEAIHGK